MRIPLILLSALLLNVAHGTLYGYWADPVWMTKQIVIIDTKTGDFQAVCDMSFLPVLAGASSSANQKDGKIHLYQEVDNGDVNLVTVDPTICDFDVTPIQGLLAGQDEVRDIKYDNKRNKLYMVLPDPNCMHGSLDELDEASASVVSTVAQLVDPEGLSQTASISNKEGKYYYIGLEFPPIDTNYRLNVIDLSSGNSTSQLLISNDLGLGNMWDLNYTLNVWDSPQKGATVFGAVSPANNNNKNCYPSGFYNVDVATGNVTCVNGPIPLQILPIAEIDTVNNLFYQVFVDKQKTYYLYTYDIAKQSVVGKVVCDVCGVVEVLTFIP